MITKPTYLYIKQHTITGMKYLGKTQQNPESYLGSGKYWKLHIKKHGKEFVVTTWKYLFNDQNELVEFAKFLSEELDIINNDSWANLKEENGLDGNPKGTIVLESTRRKISDTTKGIQKSMKHKENMKNSNNSGRFKNGNSICKGRQISSETKEKLKMIVINASRDSVGRFV